MESGDDYKRVYVGDGRYQCGCAWHRQMYLGDVLFECDFHRQVTEARVSKFEREKGTQNE